MTEKQVMEILGLKPLPEEGGYYREVYRSRIAIPADSVGLDGGTRNMSTAIYYMLTPNSFSVLHRVKSDEVYHFYSGDPAEMIQISTNGLLKKYVLGCDLSAGQSPLIVVPSGTWQGMRLRAGGSWSLMGTTVSPGFEFQDFEAGDRDRLLLEFPKLATEIMRFTRGPNEASH
ncbi:MAG: hypothetical protein C5B49_01225 [Bdellovibrio sp.]|nr:MAG: hypothetical protein C5B49_01225 [Bdellovibrio sp.]